MSKNSWGFRFHRFRNIKSILTRPEVIRFDQLSAKKTRGLHLQPCFSESVYQSKTAVLEPKILTLSVFELQKRLSSQTSCPGNFQNLFVNKFFDTRPLTLVFGDGDIKKTAVNSCWQLITAVPTLASWSTSYGW